ncbi:type VI secretion system secreted protein VgrG [Rubrivivax gelatinosus]|uniref:type VI secretion system Vgr family protein n=2 Tax=Rubrivivax gelatinosus TaxID=28068 RepID=UPI0018C954A4|nr:type VI secretion system tip protein TssI/VgrG [Rubrivivax gelatinosus]MBG6082926.1 type VI secretion system secreted protein VgrG [Rubrivivax gelatinosus]
MSPGEGLVGGWSLQGRLLRVQTPPGQVPLLARRLEADEAVGRGFELQLEVLAEAGADVDALLGEELGVHLQRADGSERAWYGLVVESRWAGAAAGGERWTLRLGPWSTLLEQRVGCALHEDASVAAILEQVFAGLPQAHWVLALTRELPRRPLCTQYAETDWAFCTRLMAEEGLAWHFEALQGEAAEAAAASGRWRHRLVVADEGTARAELGPLRFAADPPTATAGARHDSVDRLAEHHGGGPARVLLGSWCSRSGGSLAAASESDLGAGPRPEHHERRGVDRFADRSAAGVQAERLLRAFELGRQRVRGEGNARDLAAGTVVVVQGLPGDEAGGRRFTVLAVHHKAANALEPDRAHAPGAAEPAAGRYRNRFDAVPAERALVTRRPPRPTAPGLQTATVVGVEHGLPMADGALRVKLRYAWQGDADPGGDGLAQTPWPLRRAAGRRGSAWVRVAQSLAGAGWGSVFVPRVGAEVLVGFLNGELDRPVVLGALFNGRDPPPYAGAPLAGIVSACQPPTRGCAGEWVLDDTTGQLRTRLASLPMAAELGLGWLVAQPAGTAGRSGLRGVGFEAVTAGTASLRAGQGLLLTTHARAARGGSCDGEQMDVQEVHRRLESARATAAALRPAGKGWPSALADGPARAAQALPPPAGPAAAATRADGLDSSTSSTRSTSTEGHAPETAWLVLAAEATLAVASDGERVHTAARDVAAVAGGAWQAAAGQDAAFVAGGAVRLASTGAGVAFVAGHGEAALRAHAGGLALHADGPLQVSAQGGELRLVARHRLVLRAAGSEIVLDGADLRLTTPGVLTVAAAAHRFPGPGRVPAPRPALPQGRPGAPPNWIEIEHHDAEGRPFAGQRYRIRFEGGSTIEGRLDAQGHARHEQVPERAEGVDYEAREPLPAPPWPPLAELVDALRERLG